MSLRIAFMGSPDFAVPSLRAMVEARQDVVCVYSQPPRPAGRGQALRKTPVHAYAEAQGLPVRTPESFKPAEEKGAFAALRLDLAVVAAYGLILPRAILEAPRLGCINLHASLLPRWRGAAPIQRAIMAGDRMTGVQVMRMEAGLDTGPILLTAETPIDEDDTSGSVHDRLAALAAPLLMDALALLEAGNATFRPQAQDGVIYAHKLSPEETRIDWGRPAREVDRHIRALSPAPGAWFLLPSEKGQVRCKALMSRLGHGAGPPGQALDDRLLIACGEGAVRLLAVQREGKGPMSAEHFLRGSSLPEGAVLG